MFSQTAEYALRAVVWLAAHTDEGPVGSQRIAEETQVSATYLSKIMVQLAKAGLVSSKRGAGGGFELLGNREDVTVLDVIDAVDPIGRFEDCPLKLATHKKQRCAMHASLNEATDEMRRVLSRHSINDLLTQSTRPIPMVDKRPRRRR